MGAVYSEGREISRQRQLRAFAADERKRLPVDHEKSHCGASEAKVPYTDAARAERNLRRSGGAAQRYRNAHA